MSERKHIISRRFFEVINRLIEMKIIRGNKTFTDRYELNRTNFRECEKTGARFQVEWLVFLVEDFNVSADWLLTGRGKMFSAPPVPYKKQKESAA